MERWRDAEWINEMTVSLDYSNMMSDYIGDGRGISKQEIDGLASRAVEISAGIEVRKKGGEFGFYRLPYDSDNVNAVLNTAGLYQGKYEDFVVLGIGGSALGGSALFQAFCHPQHNLLSSAERNGLPRIFYLDNIDLATFKSILGVINFEKTLFNIIFLLSSPCILTID